MSDALARLGWQDFEHLLAEHYREQGYRVELRSAVTSLKTLGSGLDLQLQPRLPARCSLGVGTKAAAGHQYPTGSSLVEHGAQ